MMSPLWNWLFGVVRERIRGEYEVEAAAGHPFRFEDSERMWSEALERWRRLSPAEREAEREQIRTDWQWAYPEAEVVGRPHRGYCWDPLGMRLMRLTVIRDPETFRWSYAPLETIRHLKPKLYRDLLDGDAAGLSSWDQVADLPRRAWVDLPPPSR